MGNFFLAALKAGGKLHGEPQIRDVKLRYYSAVVLDADGNRVEAVYCPGDSSARSEVSTSDMSALDDRSFVSKAYSRASSTRPESTISRSRSEAKSYASRATTAVDRGPPSAAPAQTPQKKPDETSPAARTIVGSLIGAAAGAAIAYAWTSSGQSGQSDEQAEPSRASAQYTSSSGPSQSRSREDPPETFRAIDDGRSMASSRGPRSAYEGGNLSDKMSDMAIDANRDTPVRALEYSPSMWDDDQSATSSAVRSYVDKPSKSKSKSKAGSSARVPTVPEGSVASFSSYRTGASKTKSSTSARQVPLPESVVGVDVDTNVAPDDSISQVPVNDYDEGSTYSRRSSRAGGSSRVSSSKKSSTFDEPVRPGDSVSQVSCNSRATERTAKPGSSRVNSSRRQAV